MSKNFVVLLYHGVTKVTAGGIENFSGKHVLASRFASQMEHLRANWNVVSFPELLRMNLSGDVPPATVAVTFDDGFENNYSTALPILQEHSIPATFFLATGFIGTGRTFWVDKVEYLINESSRRSLELESVKESCELTSADLRIEAVKRIKSHLKKSPGLIGPTIEELEGFADQRPAYDYPNYRMLTWPMVREMAESHLVHIGAHTVDHEILSHLDRTQKWDQIAGAKTTLEMELGGAIELFSYPEGQEDHFDDETIELLRLAGYTSSPTAIFGVNEVRSSAFHLRRNMVEFVAPFERCLEPV